MRKSEILAKAVEFCNKNHIDSYPVQIIKLCNEQGLKVFEDFLAPDVSGMIIVDDQVWPKYGTNKFIVVNLSESPMRRRFTIAHELGHFILHKDSNTLYAHRDMVNTLELKNSIEAEANYFAANILMPEELVRYAIEDIEEQSLGRAPEFLLIKEIADRFAVSEAAAKVRLKQLNAL